MMGAWIELNGVSSESFGYVTVQEITPFLLAQRRVSRAEVSGKMGGVEQGEPTFGEGEISVRLLVRGADRPEAMARANALTKWLAGGTKLRLWFDAGRYCLGRILDGVSAERVGMKLVRLSFRFTASPPCFMKVRSALSTWEPDGISPIPEQITGQTATCAGAFTAPGRLPVMTDGGAFTPLLYFALTGTWTTISVGSLVITQAYATAHTVYVDCDAEVVYTLDAGQRVNVPAAGAFPVFDASGIMVGGTNIDATVRALLIERG